MSEINTVGPTQQNVPTHASISKDNELNTFVIRIFDDESGDLIREIPNEAMQRFARNLKQIQGLLFDTKM